MSKVATGNTSKAASGTDMRKLEEDFELVLDGKSYSRDRIIRAVDMMEKSIRRISNARKNRKARENAVNKKSPQV
jgi:hypothetical protein